MLTNISLRGFIYLYVLVRAVVLQENSSGLCLGAMPCLFFFANCLLNILQGGDGELMIRKLMEGIVPIKSKNQRAGTWLSVLSYINQRDKVCTSIKTCENKGLWWCEKAIRLIHFTFPVPVRPRQVSMCCRSK